MTNDLHSLVFPKNNSALKTLSATHSAGEMMVGPRLVMMMDEISTGLDSSTTFQMVQSLRHMAHLQRATICVALLQPAPEVFDLFDDLMVLADGMH